MILLLETALTVLLVWLMASCSLIVGMCITACALRLNQCSSEPRYVLCGQYQWRQKSDLYLD